MAAAKQTTDFFKTFSDFKMPALDYNELFNVGRRNLEAYSAANQVMIEGVQAINKRSAEVLQHNMEKCMSASRDMFTATNGMPEINAQKQTAVAKDVFESCVNSVREISEMASKSTFEAFDVLNKRASEAMEEAGKIAKKAA